MGDKVRWLQGWLHGQLRVAKKLQQEYRQGAAGMPQECPGWVKRLQEQPQVTQKEARAAITPQEKPWLAIELQEMQAVAQPPEAKLSGVANPLPWVVELLQPWASGSAQPPWDVLVQCAPPNLPAGHVLTAQQPLVPPPWWPHLFLGRLPPLPLLPPRAGEPALCPSQLGAATLHIWWAPHPGPLS